MAYLDILFLVPARAGSKRFEGKNRAVFKGKELWCHAASLCHTAAGMFWSHQGKQGLYRVVVSTDDAGIPAPPDDLWTRLQRPDHLATDDATSEAVALHALEHYPADMVCLIQPTSPLRRPLDIVRCVLACPAYTINRDYGLEPTGAVYTHYSEALRAGEKFGDARGYVPIPDERSIDVDTEEDLHKAIEYAERVGF